MDHYPTLLELAGFPLKEKQHVDGTSYLPWLKDPAKSFDRTLVWHYPHYHGSTWRPGSAIRMNQWKLIEFYEEEKIELYNLEDDPAERMDLSSKYPERSRAMKEKMHQYIDTRGGSYPVRK
jgi:arylsulfatase A-like enzyme